MPSPGHHLAGSRTEVLLTDELPVTRNSELNVVVKVGAEGGALTLYRRARPAGREAFFTELNQVALYEMMEDDGEPMPGEPFVLGRCVATLEEGLALLDESPEWVLLYPVEVDIELAPRVLAAVEARLERCGLSEEEKRRRWVRWRDRCAP